MTHTPRMAWSGDQHSPPPPPSRGLNSDRKNKGQYQTILEGGKTWTSCVVSETWKHWLFKPSRQEKAEFAVNRYSATGRLLQWSLKQPLVPLSEALYEQGQFQQDQDLQCGATVKGTYVLVAHRLTNLQASRNQFAQQVSQTPFCTYSISLWSPTQHLLRWSLSEPRSFGWSQSRFII